MKWASSTFIDWKCELWRFGFRIYWRRKDGFMGRFGGGWNWKLGIQAGGSTVIFNLLVFDVSLMYQRKQFKKSSKI